MSRPRKPAPRTPGGGRPIERRAPAGSWAALLSAAREAEGISRAKLAELVGTKPAAVTRWESGDVEIGESVVRRYAAALGRRVVLTLPPAREGEKP